MKEWAVQHLGGRAFQEEEGRKYKDPEAGACLGYPRSMYVALVLD